MNPTDYFDQPLSEGDTIVYPIQKGSSGATLKEAVITGFVRLIEHPDPNTLATSYLVREDQLHKANPTTFYKARYEKRPYIVKVRVKTTVDGKHMTRTLHNVQNIVKGPAE